MQFYRKNNSYLIATENQVFKADSTGVIEKNYPLNNLPATATPIESIPFDFNASLTAYGILKNQRKAEREAHRQAEALKAYKERKKGVLNLRAWRSGEVDAYCVVSRQELSEPVSQNYETDVELFFSLLEAEKHFNEIKTTTPEIGYYFRTELRTTPDCNRLEITTIQDLTTLIFEGDELLQDSMHAEPIKENEVIITLYHGQHGSSGKYVRAEYPSYKQTTTADLVAFQDNSFTHYQVLMTDVEAVESYEEQAIEDLELSNEWLTDNGFEHLIKEETN